MNHIFRIGYRTPHGRYLYCYYYERSKLYRLVEKTSKHTIKATSFCGLYTDGEGSKHSSLHANMFALAFGLVPKENNKKIISFIKTRGMACSVYGSQYLLEALYKQSESDYALSQMNSTEGDRNWWNMIRVGSTMTLEAWDIKYKPNLDWNHAWGTAPANIITRYLWGIRPASPGFRKVIIQPQMSHLTFSRIKAPSPQGSINAEFKKINDSLRQFILVLPSEMEGEFMITDSDYSVVLLNNKAIKPKNGLIPLVPGINHVEVRNQ